MEEEKRSVEQGIVQSDTPSPRVPVAEGEVWSYYKAKQICLPIASVKRLFLPKMNMRHLVERQGRAFPCRFTEDVEGGGELDVAVTREGFLIRADHADVPTLLRLLRYLLETYRVVVVPYDVIYRPADDCRQAVLMIRLIPCRMSSAEERHPVTAHVTRYFRPVSDDLLVACMNVKRPVPVSEFTEETLDLAAELPHPAESSVKPLGRSRKRAVKEPVSMHLCSLAEMERRIEREPTRQSNSGSGSLSTLGLLCQAKNLIQPRREDLRRVLALREGLPNFIPVIDYIARKLEAQRLCRNPMRLPPLLLLGDAGVGKSHFCRVLSEAIAMPFECVAVAGSAQELHITGLSKSWGSAGPSRFAEIMAGSAVANPLIMVDEIDKASDIKVQNALLQIFEPETAARWVDQYVEVPLDLSRVLFVATANDQAAISPVLLSRFEVFEIEKPSPEQWLAVFNSIYANQLKQFGDARLFAPDLPEGVAERLIGQAMTPREARRVLLDAMELAVIRTHRQRGRLGRGQVRLQLDDLPVPRHRETVSRMGFI